VSTLSAQTIQDNLGSQEFPEVMNYTPSVYATKSSGGFGDSRINVRGFDQRNIAVMINGIPVNDMENGWVYWSNWAGLGDATRNIQIQRGLSASKIAINSVGGTINIITKTTDMSKGGMVEVAATDFGRFKTTVALSTGKLKSGTAVTFVGSRTFGQGYIESTWVDAWSYFLSVSQDIGDKHQLVFTGIGAPQQHGQRDGFYMLDSATFERYGPRYTQNWGWRGGEELNERVNYYHKPQFALNWYYNINEKAFLATSAYISTGNGGGSGPLGIRDGIQTADGDFFFVRFEPPQDNSGRYNWDLMADINAQDMFAIDDGDTTVYPAGESKHIIRNSVNNHFWYGVLSTFKYKFTDRLKFLAGIDGRSYLGEHYREVRDLVGGDYWEDGVFGQVQRGDKIAYWNDGIVRYGGIFAQLEYTNGTIAAFFSGTLSNTWTKRVDYYSYQEGVVTEDYARDNANISETLSNIGWNLKAGFNWNINENNNIFVNGGAFSRVPFFRFHFLNFRNEVNPDLKNEVIYAGEIGYGFKSRKFNLNLNGYYTVWDQISQLAGFRTEAGQFVNAFISELQAVHMGIELDFQWTITRWVNVGGLASFGSWEYANDPTADLYDDQTLEYLGTGTLFLDGLKVPDQPQTQFGYNVEFVAAKRLTFALQHLFYDNLYAQYTLEDRTNPDDRSQAWKLPAYNVVNGRIGWRFQFAGLDSELQINVYNLFDTEALMEAEDTAETRPDGTIYHTFDKGFWVWGRNFNFALRVRF
jgi:hypothetical protein